MKKLAVLVGLLALLTYGTGAWADSLTMSGWTKGNDNIELPTFPWSTILQVIFTDIAPGEVQLTISSGDLGSSSKGPLTWTNFVANYTGSSSLSFAVDPLLTTVPSESITWTQDAYLNTKTFPWPPDGGNSKGAGLAIGTADLLMVPGIGLGSNSTLVIDITGAGLTSSQFDGQMLGGPNNLPNGNFFGAVLTAGTYNYSTSLTNDSADLATVVPIPPSLFLLAGGLGGLGLIRRRRAKH